ncbi:MAG: hypothetical protein AAFN77_18180 [Planctomycetota bacterium]
MARLRIISNQVRKPVNQLLKEAVEYYTTEKLPEFGVDSTWKWGDACHPSEPRRTANGDTTQEEIN